MLNQLLKFNAIEWTNTRKISLSTWQAHDSCLLHVDLRKKVINILHRSLTEAFLSHYATWYILSKIAWFENGIIRHNKDARSVHLGIL